LQLGAGDDSRHTLRKRNGSACWHEKRRILAK
jgi:hypothetical protein